MTEKSRAADELIGTSLESDDFVDAVLNLAETQVSGVRQPMMRESASRGDHETAVDMVDGAVLAASASDADSFGDGRDSDGRLSDDVVLDLTDGTIDRVDGEPLAAPVAKALSRSAASARAQAVAAASDDLPSDLDREHELDLAIQATGPEPADTSPEEEAPAGAAEAAIPTPRTTPPTSTRPTSKSPQPKSQGAKPAESEPSRPPVVDLRGATAAAAPVKRRRSRIRRMRRAFREYMIRRGRGSTKVPLTTRWRNARLRRMRAQRRAATQAALLGQDPAEVRVSEPNLVGYAAAVLVVAAIVVIALVVLI